MHCLFLNRISCDPGWPGTCYVTESDFARHIFLHPEWQDYQCLPLHPDYTDIFTESAGYVVGIPITSHSLVDLFLQDRDRFDPILIFSNRLLPAKY